MMISQSEAIILFIDQSQARNSGVTSVSDQAVARLRHGSGASVVKVSYSWVIIKPFIGHSITCLYIINFQPITGEDLE